MGEGAVGEGVIGSGGGEEERNEESGGEDEEDERDHVLHDFEDNSEKSPGALEEREEGEGPHSLAQTQ